MSEGVLLGPTEMWVVRTEAGDPTPFPHLLSHYFLAQQTWATLLNLSEYLCFLICTEK